MAEEECEIKIAVVGESGVGKSCIISSFCSSKEGETTEGQEITIEKIEVEGKEIRLQIIDAAGTKDIRKSLFKGARGIMVVYDITDENSFKSCSKWLQDIDQHCERYPTIAVIGNKCDMEDRRVITKKALEKFAIAHGVCFMEVSGMTGVNIRESFKLIAEEVLYENAELRESEGRNHCCRLL